MNRFAAFRASIVAAAALAISACGINSVPAAEETAKAKWADVEAAFPMLPFAPWLWPFLLFRHYREGSASDPMAQTQPQQLAKRKREKNIYRYPQTRNQRPHFAPP